jgi:hypothetical protein
VQENYSTSLPFALLIISISRRREKFIAVYSKCVLHVKRGESKENKCEGVRVRVKKL